MTEIMRQRASILALVGELVARRIPQHVGMYWEWKPRSLARSLDHSGLVRLAAPPVSSPETERTDTLDGPQKAA